MPPSVSFTAGGKVAVTSGGLLIRGGFSDSVYERSYVTTRAAPTGGLSELNTEEQDMVVDLTIGYEILHHASADVARYLVLFPFIGGGSRTLLNPLAPINVMGPEAGARAEVAPSDSIVVGVEYGFLYNLLGYDGVPLVFGTPKFDQMVGVDLSLRLVGASRIKLQYQSDYMTFTDEYRAYQTLAVGFDYGF